MKYYHKRNKNNKTKNHFNYVVINKTKNVTFLKNIFKASFVGIQRF